MYVNFPVISLPNFRLQQPVCVLGTYGSEDDCVSHGEGSDGGDARPQLPEFIPPDDDLKDKIIKQVPVL